jgi:preprotein translocase subunit SecF
MDLIPNIYASKHYRRLILIPVVLLVIALAVIYAKGIPQGIDLRGGILVTLESSSPVDAEGLKADLASSLGVSEVSVKTGPGTQGGTSAEIEIEQNENLASAERALRVFYEAYQNYSAADYEVASYSSALDNENLSDREFVEYQLEGALASRAGANASMYAQATLIQAGVSPFIGQLNVTPGMDSLALKNVLAAGFEDAKGVYKDKVVSVLHRHMTFEDYTYKEVSPSLSEFFLQKTIQVVIVSFILTTVVVLAVFRSFVPSLAVIFGAFNDIVFALGAMALFGIPLTLASVGALLMLIGFSLDTDMLLTIRIMKRAEDTPRKRAFQAMKTGMFMTTTAIAAFALLFALSMVTQLPTYYQISAVVICGLIGDLIATWCTNAVIVLWDKERSVSKG